LASGLIIANVVYASNNNRKCWRDRAEDDEHIHEAEGAQLTAWIEQLVGHAKRDQNDDGK
jgi:hypothetical protein